MANNAQNGLERWISDFITPVTAAYWPDELAHDLDTPLGKLRGSQHEGIAIYRGIPYAKPPVGTLRFAPPQKVESWQGAKDATRYGSLSHQAGEGDFSEDCLSLNVWTPDVKTETPLPVFVFIHGGGFVLGSGSQPLYEGKRLAQQGVVVVTVNYRLGTLGFLPSNAALKEHGTTGNWGLLDIIAALQWVQDNIRAFGGDPAQVTVGGESAGSYAVSALIASPLAKGLFQQAIMESGSLPNATAVAPETALSLQQAQTRAGEFFAQLGLEDDAQGLAALREIPLEKLLSIQLPVTLQPPQVPGFWPIPDGHVYPARPVVHIQRGNINPVRLLAGFNSDEGSLFVAPDATEQNYHDLIKSVFGPRAEEVLQRYPVDAQHNVAMRMNQLITLSMLRSGLYIYADALSAQQDVFVYHFDAVDPDLAATPLGVIHGSELKFIFQNLIDSESWDDKAMQIAGLMQTAWVNFIKYGDPNQTQGLPGNVVWDKYQTQQRRELRINQATQMQPVFNWDDVEFINQRLQQQG